MTYSIPKVGDIVKLPQHRGNATGVVVDNTCETGWLDILLEDGELIKWPTVQIQVIRPDVQVDNEGR